MSWVVAIIVGALIGWLVSRAMKIEDGLVTSVIAGAVGAALIRWLLVDLLALFGAHAPISLVNILVALIGAAAVVAVLRAAKVLK
jgi:uncharacterized membrane protein YeaQ/YmgE (transglycosylase-associated protein family)